ncbi:metallophosphoesterase [Streptomyces sp. NPDC091376]|uniref:metallophosphoesterase n=1 Tax=Streptomyces sp. NPDC091376 TaxID=3365994 RepID=UPI0037F93C49
MLVVLLVIAVVVALLAGVHWYVWRRLVRDTTAGPGAVRRAGTAAVVLLPVLSVGALASGRAGAPFWLQQILAWPGFLWLATLLYLTLALVVGEAARPLLRRALSRRADARSAAGARATAAGSGTVAVNGGTAASAAETGDASREEGGPQDAEVLEGTGSVAVSVAVATDDGSGAGGARGHVRAMAPADADADADAGTDTRTHAVSDATAASGDAADVRPEATASTAGAVPAGGVSRRLFVARMVGGAAGAVAAGTVGYGAYGVLRGPKVKRVTVPLAKLVRGMHGYRIAVVSDIHLGPVLGRAHAQRIVDTINATQPDLVAIVGDLVDGSVADLGRSAEPLAQLRARDGSYFVTGNHEYFSGADAWVDHVRELGLTPLRNDRVEIAGFDLAGVDDIAGESEGQGPDFARALGDRDRGRAAVLLAHQPVVIHDAVRHGVDLQLSGHTHGGQLWPGNYLAELANPTVAGLEKYGDTQLYVSRGAGAWGPPVRVGAPSDITVVELASRHA